jgi:hypothetical protein
LERPHSYSEKIIINPMIPKGKKGIKNKNENIIYKKKKKE